MFFVTSIHVRDREDCFMESLFLVSLCVCCCCYDLMLNGTTFSFTPAFAIVRAVWIICLVTAVLTVLILLVARVVLLVHRLIDVHEKAGLPVLPYRRTLVALDDFT